MYQRQIFKRVKLFHQLTGNSYHINRLLHEREYRNRALKQQLKYKNEAVTLLVHQIQTLDELSDYEFKVEVLAHHNTNNKPQPKKMALLAFALAGLVFIASSVYAVESIKHRRLTTSINQAD